MTDQQEILELYKTYVGTIASSEQRRQTLSAFYTSLIAVAGALLASQKYNDPIWISLAVLVVSVVWFLTVRYFRRLASAKFKVIKEMEAHFEMRPFEREWHYFKHKSPKNLGSDTKVENETVEPRKWARWTLTHYDQVIPLLTALSSFGYLVSRIWVE